MLSVVGAVLGSAGTVSLGLACAELVHGEANVAR